MVRTGNTSVVFHINHQGGTRSFPSLHLTQALLTWAETRFLSLHAIHIPGRLNVVSGALSRRGQRAGDLHLHKEVVPKICNTYCTVTVDLFPSKETTQCPMVVCRDYRTGVIGQGCIDSQVARCITLFAFPPV